MPRKAPTRPKGAGSNPSDVGAFMAGLQHLRKAEIEELRTIIRGAEPRIREAIKWNAPSYHLEGHEDQFATFKLRPLETDQAVFHTGAKVKPKARPMRIDDPAGLLTWAAKDRCLATLTDMAEVRARKSALQAIVRQWSGQL